MPVAITRSRNSLYALHKHTYCSKRLFQKEQKDEDKCSMGENRSSLSRKHPAPSHLSLFSVRMNRVNRLSYSPDCPRVRIARNRDLRILEVRFRICRSEHR